MDMPLIGRGWRVISPTATEVPERCTIEECKLQTFLGDHRKHRSDLYDRVVEPPRKGAGITWNG